jgi:hypothetical protein
VFFWLGRSFDVEANKKMITKEDDIGKAAFA